MQFLLSWGRELHQQKKYWFEHRSDRNTLGSWVRTEFKTLSRLYFQNNNFSQTQDYQIGDQKRPWKTQKQSFFLHALQTYGRDRPRFDQNEKNFTSKALVVTLKTKKNLRLLTINYFSRLYLYFQTFFRSRKLLGKFQDFFKNPRLCMNLKQVIVIFRSSNIRNKN